MLSAFWNIFDCSTRRKTTLPCTYSNFSLNPVCITDGNHVPSTQRTFLVPFVRRVLPSVAPFHSSLAILSLTLLNSSQLINYTQNVCSGVTICVKCSFINQTNAGLTLRELQSDLLNSSHKYPAILR